MTVLLADIKDFGPMNEIYGEFFKGVCPARACFQVAALPKGALVEIEAFAVKLRAFVWPLLFAAVFFYLGYMLVNPNLYNNKEYMNYCNKM